MPKPPPTSWVSTRIAVSGTLNTPSASSLRTTATPCVEAISVYFCFASSHMPMPERGSSETGASRVSSSRTRSTWAALAKAASVAAAFPSVQSSAMLPGRSSWIATAPLAVALSTSGAAREFFEIDLHALGCIERLRQRLRHDDRDALADIADAVDRERRHRGGEHRLAVAAGKDRDRRDRAKAVIAEIAAGEHAEHARHPRACDTSTLRIAAWLDGRAHEHP